MGAAVVRLVFACDDFDAAAARVSRALASDGSGVRQLGFVAVGDMTRVFRRLTPEIYGSLRVEGLGGVADTAFRDALTFVPFRDLPLWFQWKRIALTVLRVLEGYRLRLEDAAISRRDGLRRVWRSRRGRC
ncbi:hypothetical protein LO771_19810 [Streptacidiphilus sp. ASG 303]|uniref:hypothetical protein n=1 Tax=Streptacidiphilus sp. ASG 303 TaxID=2896847 RepID=UPI001E42EEC9|nr:hypothetical protein [Streptacidiphilus sp. ASG 303]MCD0484579.1 hypothetical protein [Streptacidiphilus sp. ASG 303]